MIKKLFSLAAMALLLASCTNDVDNVNRFNLRALKDAEFYATIVDGSDSETKVFADSQMRVLWNAGDQISIFNKNTYNQPYRFKGEDGDNGGGFEKAPSGDEFAAGGPVELIYAVYPYASSTKVSYDGEITLSLPTLQHFKEHSFGIGANTMVSVTEDNLLKFRNVGGYLSFKFYGEGISIKHITLKGNNNEKLAGKATVTMPLGGIPSLEMHETAGEEVTLTCDSPVALNASAEECTEFWFVLPPTTFSGGFTVSVTDEKGGVFTKTTSAEIVIKRNTISHMAAMRVVPDYGYEKALTEKKRMWQYDLDTVALMYRHKEADKPVAKAYHPLNWALDNLDAAYKDASESKSTLLKASKKLAETFNGIIPHYDISSADSAALFVALMDFARARQKYLEYTPYSTRPATPYDNKDYFYFAFAISPTVLVDSILYSNLTIDMIRNNKALEYDVNGQRVGNGNTHTLVHIARQLCGNTFANALEQMGYCNVTLIETDLNTTGFYDMYRYVPGETADITYLDGSPYTPQTVTRAISPVVSAVNGLNALWMRFWGEDLGAVCDSRGYVTIPPLNDLFDPLNYKQEDFTEPECLVSFDNGQIVWTEALGAVLGACDPYRQDVAGQSFNYYGLVKGSAIFGVQRPTDFFYYMRALYEYNQFLSSQDLAVMAK